MASRFFPLYNIDQPVGPGKPNLTQDVRLVQALFVETSRFEANLYVLDIPADMRSLATTGQFDDKLKTWIVSFQKWATSHFGGDKVIHADGIVDPMPTASIAVLPKFPSGRIATLGFLCNRLWRYNRMAYLKIGDDYNIPWIPQGWGS